MFNGCESLSNINLFEKWNASNRNDFYKILYECKLLLDLKGLEKWNVSNGNYVLWIII